MGSNYGYGPSETTQPEARTESPIEAAESGPQRLYGRKSVVQTFRRRNCPEDRACSSSMSNEDPNRQEYRRALALGLCTLLAELFTILSCCFCSFFDIAAFARGDGNNARELEGKIKTGGEELHTCAKQEAGCG